ncbi:dihydroxyacetone kinase subunit DhaK [Streptomyces sp. S1D4-11]
MSRRCVRRAVNRLVYETVKPVTSPKGVLLLVNNYTGDRMAFEMAEELPQADGVTVTHSLHR